MSQILVVLKAVLHKVVLASWLEGLLQLHVVCEFRRVFVLLDFNVSEYTFMVPSRHESHHGAL